MADGRQRGWRRLVAVGTASAVVIVVSVGSLLPHLSSSAELVRMRNALLLDDAAAVDFTPASRPPDYLVERSPADASFAAVVRELGAERVSSDWERALVLARHLLVNAGKGRSGGIMSDLDSTYRRIVEHGDGYCGDYTDAFTGLALAAGLDVRTWAFSFDGFGGNGHIFNEVWDRAAGRWKMIDVFHNYYFTLADGEPLSALAFHDALRRDDPALRMVRIRDDARPGFKFDDRALDYYRRGLGEWYLWWGNNVFSYDEAALVKLFANGSRSLEQLGAIAQGVHPRIRVLDPAANRAKVESMHRLRVQLLIVLVVCVAAAVAFAVAIARHFRGEASPRRRPEPTT